MSAPAGEDFGGYKLTNLLGKGGMASVYRAVKAGPMGFAKEVAVKRIHKELTDNEELLKGLINEARLGGQLKHPNIVEVYEFDKVGDTYYLAMEFVDGWTLDHVLNFGRKYHEAMPIEVVVDIMIQVCAALDYAHTLESLDGKAVNLVHRDLKPGNIIVAKNGVAKLMDFGIAKASTNLFHTTVADTTKGTPYYMSPEQVAGAKDLKATSDIFALGSVLYELATQTILFRGESLPAVLFAVVKADVKAKLALLDQKAPGLSPMLTKCLQKKPQDRYQSARELGTALEAYRDTLPGTTSTRDYLFKLRTCVIGQTREAQDDQSTQADAVPQFATLVQPALGEDGEKSKKQDLSAAVEAEAEAELRALQKDAQELVGGEAEDFFGDFGDSDPYGPTVALETPSSLPAGPTPNSKAQLADPAATRVFSAEDAAQQSTGGNKGLWAAIIALLMIVSGGGVFFATRPSAPVAETPATPAPAAAPTPEAEPAAETPAATAQAPQRPAAKPTTRRPTATPATRPAAATRPARILAATPAPEPVATAAPTPSPPTPAPAAPQPTPTSAAPAPAPAPTPAAAPAPVAAAPVSQGKGTLAVKKSEPVWANVIVDGRDIGVRTPVFGHSLSAGQHMVELVAANGLGRVTRSITVEPDKTIVVGSYNFTTQTWSK